MAIKWVGYMQDRVCSYCNLNRFFTTDYIKYYCDNCRLLYVNPNKTNQEEQTNEIPPQIGPGCSETLSKTGFLREIESISQIQSQLAQTQQQEARRLKDHLTCARLRRNDEHERKTIIWGECISTRTPPIPTRSQVQGQGNQYGGNQEIHQRASVSSRRTGEYEQINVGNRISGGPDWEPEAGWDFGTRSCPRASDYFGARVTFDRGRPVEPEFDSNFRKTINNFIQDQTDIDEIHRWEDEGGRVEPEKQHHWLVHEILKLPFQCDQTENLSSGEKAERAQKVRKFFASRAITIPANAVSDEAVLKFAETYQMLRRAWR